MICMIAGMDAVKAVAATVSDTLSSTVSDAVSGVGWDVPRLYQAGEQSTLPAPSLITIVLGGVLVLLVGGVLLRRILKLRSALKLGYAGSQLQTRVVKAFSLVTIIPTLVISIFSIAFFYFGVNDWFNTRITTLLEESVAVAEAYRKEHQRTLRADAMAMASDLQRDLELATTDPQRFAEILNGQVALRSLSEAIVLRQNQVIARSLLSFSLSFESLPERVLKQSEEGNVVIFSKEDRIFAVTAIDPLTKTYLVISRLIDSEVIDHIERAGGAAAAYNRILNHIDQFQIIFVIVFILVTMILLLTVIWYGITFASRITRPLTTVAQATERVRAGDYSIQIEEGTDNEEMDMLIRHFNRMTTQLYHQRLELTQATRMLDQRRRFTETVLSGVSAGVIAMDTNLVVNLCNISALRLLGYDGQYQLAGESLRTIIPECSALLDRALSRPGAIHEDQITMQRPGGTLILRVKISTEISQAYVEGFIATLDDITPLISAQRSAAWSDVARRVAHEIKNPLTPIKLSVGRLRKKFVPSSPEEREAFEKYLDTIARHLGDIGTIVEEFASFARLPAPQMKQTPVKPLLQETLFSAETSHPDIHYSLSLEDPSLCIACDERQIAQVLTNLLKNASESIERRHEPAAPGHIHVSCSHQDGYVVITLQDNGVGFPESLIHKIMEPYVTTRSKGTGLGLAIVKKIIEDHQAQIQVRNREESGAEVELVFPKAV